MSVDNYNPEKEIRRVENNRNTDSKLLKILKEKEYLDTEVQEDILSWIDMNEMYSALDDVFLILKKKKRKLKNKEQYLSNDDEDNLTLFLSRLSDEINTLSWNISEAVVSLLDS